MSVIIVLVYYLAFVLSKGDYVITVFTDDDITPSHIPLTTLYPIGWPVNLSSKYNVASYGTLTFCYWIILFTFIFFPGGTKTINCWLEEYVVFTYLLKVKFSDFD